MYFPLCDFFHTCLNGMSPQAYFLYCKITCLFQHVSSCYFHQSFFHCPGTASLIQTDSCKSTSELKLKLSKHLSRCTNISTRVVPSSPAGQIIRRNSLYWHQLYSLVYPSSYSWSQKDTNDQRASTPKSQEKKKSNFFQRYFFYGHIL